MITVQGGVFRVKNETLYLYILFWLFVVVVAVAVVFDKKNVFTIIKFLQQNINQSKTGIGEKNLTVELYVKYRIR